MKITAFGEYKVIRRTVTVSISVDIVDKAVLKKITIDGRPFSSVEDQSFQDLVNPWLNALGIRKKIDRHHAKKILTENATILREKLQEALKDQVFCLKMDGGVRHGRKFLGK